MLLPCNEADPARRRVLAIGPLFREPRLLTGPPFPPAIAVADAVKVLKGVTARRLFQAFPALKKQLWNGHLWSPSYYVGTAGNVGAEIIRRYIERSEHVTRRQ